MSAISNVYFCSLPSGEAVHMLRDVAGNQIMTAQIVSESDLIEIFRKFAGLTAINQECTFIYIPYSSDGLCYKTQFEVADTSKTTRQPKLTCMCQAATILPSERMLSNQRFPWELTVQAIFSSNAPERPENIYRRKKEAKETADLIQERQYKVIDPYFSGADQLLRDEPTHMVNLSLRRAEILDYITDDELFYETAFQKDAYVEIAPSPQEFFKKSQQKLLNEIAKAWENGSSFSYIRCNILKKGNWSKENPQDVNKWTQTLLGRISVNHYRDNRARGFSYYLKADEGSVLNPPSLLGRNIFLDLYEAQEERRRELQLELSKQLPVEADRVNQDLSHLIRAIAASEYLEHKVEYEERRNIASCMRSDFSFFL